VSFFGAQFFDGAAGQPLYAYQVKSEEYHHLRELLASTTKKKHLNRFMVKSGLRCFACSLLSGSVGNTMRVKGGARP
jgi:hypothetical protein